MWHPATIKTALGFLSHFRRLTGGKPLHILSCICSFGSPPALALFACLRFPQKQKPTAESNRSIAQHCKPLTLGSACFDRCELCRQRVHRTALDVIMDVESELALHGYADPSTSLFRGCHLCFLPLTQPQHAANTAAAIAALTHAASAEAASHTPAASGHAGSSKNQLFESALQAAARACATQEALMQCQAKRVALQVQDLSLSFSLHLLPSCPSLDRLYA